MGVSSEQIMRAINTLAELVATGEDRARDPLLVLGKLAEEVEGLREELANRPVVPALFNRATYDELGEGEW